MLLLFTCPNCLSTQAAAELEEKRKTAKKGKKQGFSAIIKQLAASKRTTEASIGNNDE